METKLRNITKAAGKLRILLADSYSVSPKDADRTAPSASPNDADRTAPSASQAESEHNASRKKAHSIAQLESALSRALTAAALEIYLGRRPSPEALSGEIRIPGEKPRFPAYPDFHYNISHSGGVAVCGLSDHPIGIDLQKIPEDPGKSLLIAKRFFSPKEQEALQELQDRNEPEALCRLFCRYWTSRESYIKLTGRGLAESFQNFCPDLESGVMNTLRGGSFFLTECPAPEGYCLTVCSAVPLPPCAPERSVITADLPF